MTQDSELQAMQQVVAALDGLDEATRVRVLEWAAKRFRVALTPPRASRRIAADVPDVETEFEHFADLLDAANPDSDNDRALLGGYWFQVVKGAGNFTGGPVNNVLKDTGHGIENITRALEHLSRRSPAEVRQVAKSGRSKQARKTYKLTTAGISRVQRMLSGETDNEQG